MKIIKMKVYDFINWYYSSKDDLRGLAESVISNLENGCAYNITPNDCFSQVGYIPEFLVLNKEELKDYFVDEEIENPQEFSVEWVK